MHPRRTRLIVGLGAVLFAGILALAGALTRIEVTPAPPVPGPSPTKQAARDWLFAASALTPSDPNVMGRDMRAALPLPDGGWLLSVDDRPVRCLAFDSWSCRMLVHNANTLVRLDAQGQVLAERPGALAIYQGEVFASRHIAVVQFGSLYAIDTDTLATVATLPTANIEMTRAGDRLYTWENYRRAPGATDLVERDPATLAELSRYPDITLDGLIGGAVALPEHSAFAYTWPAGADRYAVRVLPLDPTRPADAPWLANACGLERVADARVALSRGPRCASDDQDRLLELRDTRDGRVLAAAQGAFVSHWGGSALIVDGDQLIDPSTGVAVPDVPGWAVAVSDGQAISRLGDGGVALFRLAPVSTPERTPAQVVLQTACAWPDFAHVAVAQAENLQCPELQSAAGSRRIVLSSGRQPTLSSMIINSIDANASRRVITVHYAQPVTSRWAGPTAQVAVVELPASLSGTWLVWLLPDGAPPAFYAGGAAFEVLLP
jgi:hypothetical protein